jgi:hypothetical protein
MAEVAALQNEVDLPVRSFTDKDFQPVEGISAISVMKIRDPSDGQRLTTGRTGSRKRECPGGGKCQRSGEQKTECVTPMHSPYIYCVWIESNKYMIHPQQRQNDIPTAYPIAHQLQG